MIALTPACCCLATLMGMLLVSLALVVHGKRVDRRICQRSEFLLPQHDEVAQADLRRVEHDILVVAARAHFGADRDADTGLGLDDGRERGVAMGHEDAVVAVAGVRAALVDLAEEDLGNEDDRVVLRVGVPAVVRGIAERLADDIREVDALAVRVPVHVRGWRRAAEALGEDAQHVRGAGAVEEEHAVRLAGIRLEARGLALARDLENIDNLHCVVVGRGRVVLEGLENVGIGQQRADRRVDASEDVLERIHARNGGMCGDDELPSNILLLENAQVLEGRVDCIDIAESADIVALSGHQLPKLLRQLLDRLQRGLAVAVDLLQLLSRCRAGLAIFAVIHGGGTRRRDCVRDLRRLLVQRLHMLEQLARLGQDADGLLDGLLVRGTKGKLEGTVLDEICVEHARVREDPQKELRALRELRPAGEHLRRQATQLVRLQLGDRLAAGGLHLVLALLGLGGGAVRPRKAGLGLEDLKELRDALVARAIRRPLVLAILADGAPAGPQHVEALHMVVEGRGAVEHVLAAITIAGIDAGHGDVVILRVIAIALMQDGGNVLEVGQWINRRALAARLGRLGNLLLDGLVDRLGILVDGYAVEELRLGRHGRSNEVDLLLGSTLLAVTEQSLIHATRCLLGGVEQGRAPAGVGEANVRARVDEDLQQLDVFGCGEAVARQGEQCVSRRKAVRVRAVDIEVELEALAEVQERARSRQIVGLHNVVQGCQAVRVHLIGVLLAVLQQDLKHLEKSLRIAQQLCSGRSARDGDRMLLASAIHVSSVGRE
eukprot:m.203840 g.203840  ORF g.203840 m.203840 type:complete len:776 (+) comp10116_c0_seq1:384-2711(+)